MSHAPIIHVHDEHGWGQPQRRQLMLLCITKMSTNRQAAGQTVTWEEDHEGFTLYVNGAYDCRLTYAEVAALEDEEKLSLLKPPETP